MTITVTELDAHGLVYVSDAEPGIVRQRSGRGFRYRYDGQDVPEEVRQRIRSLVIPPAWAEVWVCPDPQGHIQVTGRDQAGRKQYLYHPEWTRLAEQAKFERLGDFGRQLPVLRRRVDRDLRRRGLTKLRLTALAVRLLDEMLIRVGNDRYTRDNGSFGLTTLTDDHVTVSGGTIRFEFAAKSGVMHHSEIVDRRLAELVRQCSEAGDEKLFGYDSGDEAGTVTSEDVNTYLAARSSHEFTAKDFRTWGASALVVAELAATEETDDATWSAAVDVAAEALGNTRAVCQASYVHPVLERAFEGGQLGEIWRRSRRSVWMRRAERTLLKVLKSEEMG